MTPWVGVVVHPLGLAAYALFLMFGLLARRKRNPPWLMKAFSSFAFVALVGGLFLAYYRTRQIVPTTPTNINQQSIDEIKQNSTGNGAANIGGVQGQVDVNSGTDKSSQQNKNTPDK